MCGSVWATSGWSVRGTPAYPAAVQLWNGAVTARPAVIRPGDAAETAAAVTEAVRWGVPLSVRGGGHDVAGRALRDGSLVIDVGELGDVQVVDGQAVAGGGARAADVVAAAAPHGLHVATGTAGVVGMAGLSLGGGYGPWLGTAGLAADNLLWAEVVLADGRVVRTEDEPELLWALRGGGGNFGVVTTMGIRLHPDSGLVGGMVVFPWRQADRFLARFADLVADAPDGLTLLIEMTVAPEIGPCLLAVAVWSGEPRGRPTRPWTTCCGSAARCRAPSALSPSSTCRGSSTSRSGTGCTGSCAPAPWPS